MDDIKSAGLILCILMLLMTYLKQAVPRGKLNYLMKAVISVFILLSIINGFRHFDLQSLKTLFDQSYTHSDEVWTRAADLVAEGLLREFEGMGCWIYWGRGRKQAGFVPTYTGAHCHQLCAVYIYDSHISIEIYFEHFKPPFNSKEKQQELMERFNEIPGIHITADRMGKRPSFNCAVLKEPENFKKFIAVYRDMLEEIKAYENPQE